MGCYGIGITRLIQVIASIYRKEDKLGWNRTPPYKVAVCVVNPKNPIHIEKLTSILSTLDDDSYIDERHNSFGKRMFNLEALGIPNIKVIGDK